MKQVFALATLAVLVLAGCSEQGSTLGPISGSEGTTFSKTVTIPQMEEFGTIPVEHFVGIDFPDAAKKYSVKGSVDFNRNSNGKITEFSTMVDVTVSNASGTGDEDLQTIVDKRSQSFTDSGSEITVLEEYELSKGLEGYVLQLTYTLGKSVNLQEVSIAPSSMLR